MSGIFRSYDIRGIYPEELNEELAYRIGRATPVVFPQGPIGVSRDMRSSAPSIRDALVKGLLEAGLDVVDLGMLSTCMNYFALGDYGFAGGIQVTASHNPAKYIGLKYNGAGVVPVTYEGGLALLEEKVKTGDSPPAEKPGKLSTRDTTAADYRKHILGLMGKIDPLPIVVDCSNGMGGLEFPDVFSGLLPNLEVFNEELDGTFPHHDPNPLKEESRAELVRRVRAKGAAFGAIFDGDGDRTAFVDENGEFVPTDFVAALLAGLYLKDNPGGKIVVDFRSSRAVEEYIKARGGKMIRSKVGHSYIKGKMREADAVFGGDIAGHYYFRDNYFSESSSLTVAKMLELLTLTGKPLSELYRPLKKYYSTGELNYTVHDKKDRIEAVAREFEQSCDDIDHFDGVSVHCPDYWLNVRASNTEPLVRFIAEAEDPQTLSEIKARVEKVLG